MEFGAIITGLASIAGLLLKWWLDKAPQRNKEQRYEEIQQGRQDIAVNDTAAVNSRIDKLLVLEADSADHDNGHLGSDEDTQRRIADLTRGGGLGN
jgi:hypothetical protein